MDEELEETVCDICDGEGRVPVLYFECYGSGAGMSNEEAMRMAGEVHHYEPCECQGGGDE